MAVQVLQQPAALDLTYGPNILTLTNLGSADKYVVRILRHSDQSVLADIRQSANNEGNAIFDIQKILQSYIEPSRGGIENLGLGSTNLPLNDSSLETFRYNIQIGSETSGVVTIVFSLTTKETLGGLKPYYDQFFSWNPYFGIVAGDDSLIPCTTVGQSQGATLSDWNTYQFYQEITDGKPNAFNNIDRIEVRSLDRQDHMTTTWYNYFSVGAPVPDPHVSGIEGFRIVTYSGNTVDQDIVIPNIQGNGGGPNTQYGSGTNPIHPYTFITMGTGPMNLNGSQYTDANGSTQTFSLGNPTHYYVYPVLYTPPTCLATHTGFADRGAWQAIRVNIQEADCLDYDEIQFSWLNSYGFRDYYTFRKKNERKITTRKNNYDRSLIDYGATQWNVDTYNRGTTTYSQELGQEFTAFTDYVTDEEAKYLKYLFTSPDVRVRLGQLAPQGYSNAWFGCTVLSNAYTEKTYRKDRLFQYDVRFKLSNGLKSQRG